MAAAVDFVDLNETPRLLATTTEHSTTRNGRQCSVDVYRGVVMFLMWAELLRSCMVAAAQPASAMWRYICEQQTHVQWVGAALHDLIQPSFYFLVGLSVILSIRRHRNSTTKTIVSRTVARSAALIVLGMALQAAKPREWDWYFLDTLTQIGLAYPFLVLVAHQSRKWWAVTFVSILFFYWLWFALTPVSTPIMPGNWITRDWLSAHGLDGFAAHWQKNANAAATFDLWFVNLFPRAMIHTGYSTGLTTLNFIPTLGTMILGLYAGEIVVKRAGAAAFPALLVPGVIIIGVACVLHATGLCPIVKAIWTPSWVLFSGGCCLITLAVLSKAESINGWRRLTLPFVAIGANSLVAYCLYHLYPAFMFNAIRYVIGERSFMVLGSAYEPFLYGFAVILMYWTLLFLLYWRRVFVRL